MSTNQPYITFHDGRRAPQLGMGTWRLTGDAVVPAIHAAVEAGYRSIDTAAIYGNEREVGAAIAESGVPRDEIFVTTKLWNNRQTEAPAALAESLEKLGLEQVDLYLIHWPTPRLDTYLQAWHSMEQLQAQGLTRSIGVSNFHQQHLRRLIDASDVVPAVNQIEVHPSLAQFELVDFNTELGIATEAWSPLGRRADLDDEVITGIAGRLDRTPAQVILRWHVQRGIIVFPKASSPERLRENADIFDFELSTEDMRAIDGVDAGHRVGPDPETFNRR